MNNDIKNDAEKLPENPEKDTADKAATKAASSEPAISYPELLTVSPSPHVHHPDSSRVIMLDVCIALTPALIWAIYVFGWRALTVTLVSVLSCVGFEALYEKLMKKPLTILDFSAVVTGMLLAFNLPSTVPLWLPIAGAFFAIVIVKQLFGGIGKNIVNPALAARVFLFSWTSDMTYYAKPFAKVGASALSVTLDSDAVASATPLVTLKAGGIPSESWIDMMIGLTPGVIGEVSAVLLLAGGVYLLLRRVITWHIPVSYLATVAVMSFLFAPTTGNSIDYMLYQLFSGGLMLGAIFMATDYTTSPLNHTARIIYGVGCGLITVFIRRFGGYAEGVSFAILIMNCTVYYLDKFTRRKKFGAEAKPIGGATDNGKK